MNKPVCVISCPILTSSGYGARSRDFVKALLELKGEEWDIKVLPQRWGSTEWKKPEGDMAWIAPLLINQLTAQPDYWYQITVPNEFQAIGKLSSVGVTAGIETTLCDPSWLDGVNRMNLTLVSSQHAKHVFESSSFNQQDQQGNVVRTVKLEKPVEVLLEGIDLAKYKFIPDVDLEETELVESLDNLDTEFAFLFVGHWLGGVIGEDRKNVGQTIKTFLETFKGKKNRPSLILKTSAGSPSIMDREEMLSRISSIRKEVGGNDLPNVYLLHGDFGDEDMNNLYNHPKVKAMIYAGKGEGYGRPLAEFTQAKKPIIASGWSGHLDFLHPEYTNLIPGEIKQIHPSAVAQNMLIPESGWFSANMKVFSDVMEDVHKNYIKYLDKAKRLSHHVKTTASFDSMKEQLKKHVESLPKATVLKLPQLKKIELPKLKKVE
jgi:hypothetical protein